MKVKLALILLRIPTLVFGVGLDDFRSTKGVTFSMFGTCTKWDAELILLEVVNAKQCFDQCLKVSSKSLLLNWVNLIYCQWYLRLQNAIISSIRPGSYSHHHPNIPAASWTTRLNPAAMKGRLFWASKRMIMKLAEISDPWSQRATQSLLSIGRVDIWQNPQVNNGTNLWIPFCY